MKIKTFISSFSHYRYAITILKSMRNHLTLQTILKSSIYALKTNDFIYQFSRKRSNRLLNHYRIYLFRHFFKAIIFKTIFSIRFQS